ncbi:MAG: hypothetical protein K9K64_00665 [Desulfohalobiaceae bacterium]|nr:hypothetical protein [Desulfohalobiaceae bacterium]
MTILFFPRLHAELVVQELPPGVRFFNPGLKEAGTSSDSWRPGNLPLNEDQAKRYIGESLGFGEQFSSPADLAYFAGGSPDDFYSRTSAAIRSEFSRKRAAENADWQPECRKPFLTGQMMLLLAWTLEEKNLEFRYLGEKTDNLGHRFKTNLGLDEEEAEFPPMGLQNALNGLESEVMAWPKLIPWFLLWMTDADCLFVEDRKILAEWQEAGVDFGLLGREEVAAFDFDPEESPGPTFLGAEASGLQLALLPEGKKDRPWLAKRYSVICVNEEGKPGI